MPRVILDLVTVKFLIGYRQKPMQFFGRLALFCVGAATLSALWSGSRLLRKIPLRSGVSTIFAVASLQFASFGLIGELLTRVYFKDSAHRPYVVRKATDRRSLSDRRSTGNDAHLLTMTLPASGEAEEPA